MTIRGRDPWEVRVYRAALRILPGAVLRAHGRAMAAMLRDRLAEVGPRRLARVRLLGAALFDAVRHGRAAPSAPAPGATRFRATGFVEAAAQDARFALRSLRRRPLFTAVAVGTLALGIGGTTAIFSVVDAVLVNRLPFREPETLVSVWRAWPSWRGHEVLDYVWDHIQFPIEDYLALRDGNRSFTAVEGVVHRRVPLSLGGRTEEVGVGLVTAGFFDMLGVRPVLGRTFTAEEALDGPGGPPVAVLSAQLWSRAFGADPRAVGRTIALDGRSYEVVGVLPEWFRFPSDLVTINDNAGAADNGLRDVWLPLRREDGCGNCLELVARLAPGVTLASARDDVRRFITEGPAEQLARVIPRKEFLTRGATSPLLLLFAAAGLLMLVACLNVAGLLVGEAMGRRQEVAVRAALGAGRARVAGQLLTESAILGLLGSAGGVAVAWVGTTALLRLAPPLPRLDEVGMSPRVLAFAIAAGLATGLMFGLAPTLGLAVRGTADLRTRGGTPDAGRRRVHGVVVALQVALTVTLLVAGGLFGRSLSRLLEVDPGFEPDGLATVSYAMPDGAASNGDDRLRFHAEVARVVRAVPGVSAVTATNELPFPGGHFSNGFRVERGGESVQTTFWNRSVMANYFETMGMTLLAGRDFTEADATGAPQVVVVSRSLAEEAWPGESPLGKVIFDGAREPYTWTVVGVVEDVRQKSLGAEPQPTFYRPLPQRPVTRIHLAVRVAGDPASALPALQRAIWGVDPSTSISRAGVMSHMVRDSEADEHFRALLMETFALLATALAAVGIYGITARGVAARTRELGIRVALGAGAGSLVRLVLRDGLTSALAGVALGVACAWAAAGPLARLLYEVDPRDPAVFAAVAVLALGVSAAAAWLPARRAAGADPRDAIARE